VIALASIRVRSSIRVVMREGDGGPNLDYEWIPPEHSSHITKAILMDLEANGFHIVKKA